MKKKQITRRLVVGGLGTTAAGVAYAKMRGGIPHGNQPSPQTITAITLSATNFSSNNAAPFGTFDVPMSPSAPNFSGTLTIDPASPDAAKFLITNGGALPCQIQPVSGQPDGSYHITVIAVQSGALGSPLSQPFTLIATTAGVLGSITMQELSGSERTGNIPVKFVYPLGIADLPSGKIIQIVEPITDTILDVQEENWSSDRSGKRRIVMGVAMWPAGSLSQTLAANGTKQFTVKTTTGTPLTGATITEADILATDFDCGVTLTFPDGTLYKCAARDILTASPTWSGTNNSGNPILKGRYRDGPFLCEITGSSPLINQTTMEAHPILRCQWHIEAAKAGTGAVDGGNPLLYVRATPKFENGYLFVAGAADLIYGAVITTGFASPVNILGHALNPGQVDLSTHAAPTGNLTITNSAIAHTTNYTVNVPGTDASKTLSLDGAGATLTLPSTFLSGTFNIVNYSSGEWTITNNTGFPITGAGITGTTIPVGAYGTLSLTAPPFTGSITGNVLDVTTYVPVGQLILRVGSTIVGPGVTPGTVVTSLGSGGGGVGTYNLNNSMTVGSQVMNFALSMTFTNGTSAINPATAVRSAGAWDANDQGRIIEIADGRTLRLGWGFTGTSFTNSTTVLVNNAVASGPFSANSHFGPPIPNGTYTTGNWKEHGICHLNQASWYTKVWWGVNADHMTSPDWAQIRMSKVFPNWTAPIGNYHAADLTMANWVGAAATRWKRPFRGFTYRVSSVNEGGQSDTEYLNIMPAWFHRYCQSHLDADRRLLEESAQSDMTWEFCFRNEATGDLIDYTDASTPKKLSSFWWRTTGASPPAPVTSTIRHSPWYWSYGGLIDTSHMSDAFFPMWFLSGEYLWLDQMQTALQTFWSWSSILPNLQTGYNRSFLRDCISSLAVQGRSGSWFLRSLLHGLMATPDTFALTIHDKTHYKAWLDAMMSYAKTTLVDDTVSWGPGGPRQWNSPLFGGTGRTFSAIAFADPYSFFTIIHGMENDLFDTNGKAVAKWWLDTLISGTTLTGANALANPYFMGGCYVVYIRLPTTGRTADIAQSLTMARVYEVFAKDPGYLNSTVSGNQYVGHGKTITSITGPPDALVMTFNTAYFLPVAPDNAWYIGGWVMIHSGNTIVSRGLITAVSADGTQATVDSTVTTAGGFMLNGLPFSASSYSISTNIMLPPQHTAAWDSSQYNLNGGIFSAQIIKPIYYAKYGASFAPLVDMGLWGAAATNSWNLVKAHWENIGVGVGNLPADTGSPNYTGSGMYWGNFPAAWMTTPR